MNYIYGLILALCLFYAGASKADFMMPIVFESEIEWEC